MPRLKSCPHCGKPSTLEYIPFCSKACKDMDFLAWANETYRIPSNEQPGEFDIPEDEEELSNDDKVR